MAKILVDFDSTLNCLDEHMLATCNARHGTAYEPECLTHWDALNELDPKGFVWGREVWQAFAWQLSIPPQPGAIETMRALTSAGHEPVIVSDRSATAGMHLDAWLEHHRLGVPYVLSHRERMPKAYVAEVIGIELAIEDAPHHALAIAGRGIPVYLMDKPYNRAIDCEHTECIDRVRGGWPEVAELLGLEMIEVAA
jgi:5'' nucleotidase, deoxy (Pyrimidine), cytosolic type C protein (NT5C).